MKRGLLVFVAVALIAVAGLAGWFLSGWYGGAQVERDTAFIVPTGASVTSVAGKLEEEGLIGSADAFLLRAKILGSGDPVKAGEFMLPAGASAAKILDTLQHAQVVRRMVTVPEGLPSIMVHERLMAEPLLTGDIAVPADGSILPDSYDFERGESRAAVLGRMQKAMDEFVAAEWPKRDAGIPVKTVNEALSLAAIVEKETGVPRERRMVAGLYSNRLKVGMRLQADPTIIYPITRGKPLGRRIKRSEIDAVNGYNTYSMDGLPVGPITNPGRESLLAVLHPAKTDALYMVADGSGGHAFASTLSGHNDNVKKWRAIRRERGEIP
ncbi:endolytic transglycosylase MltG [Croceicoccus ponticola]|uniref:Endolytic murein transglycosylase n=1 Tax=Croceicoccus ponticola TaxID=2217664 RepID=A0A437GUX1_9SPHN|nr:endolytic transglycosylase MltG [Croceicoccus ponticola]RVQ65299.1 endolytic transglycosylase MltG [Croceicoccus ponticola]